MRPFADSIRRYLWLLAAVFLSLAVTVVGFISWEEHIEKSFQARLQLYHEATVFQLAALTETMLVLSRVVAPLENSTGPAPPDSLHRLQEAMPAFQKHLGEVVGLQGRFADPAFEDGVAELQASYESLRRAAESRAGIGREVYRHVTRLHGLMEEVEVGHVQMARKLREQRVQAEHTMHTGQVVAFTVVFLVGLGAIVRLVGLITGTIKAQHTAEQAVRESEERFRLLAENIEAVLWVSGAGDAGPVHYVSPAFEAIWGVSRDTLRDNPRLFLDAVHPDDRERISQAFERQAEGGYDETFRIVRPDGEVRWIRDRAFPVMGPQNVVDRIVGIAADVTLVMNAEEERRRHQEELAHVARLSTLGEMASGLAHEVNQPLAAIANYARGSIHRLEATGDEAGVRPALEQIDMLSRRAGDIVRHLREFVQKGETRHAAADINELARRAVQLAEPEARRQNVRLKVNATHGLPPVRVDRIQVDQVLVNLLRNGIDAVAEHTGGGEVVVTTAQDGNMVVVSVRDTGPGVSEQVQRQLFHPFYTTKPNGLGLGLAISESIVEAHGGRIQLDANGGSGATFRFTVPVDSGQSKDNQEA
ncbi:MAG: PAS domain-containing protein [Nitrospirota bacterium]|nr:PAS domain-containing protein [Nitrospirota bacterium]